MLFLRTRVINEKVNHILKTLNLNQPVTLNDLNRITEIMGVSTIKACLDHCSGFTYRENNNHYIVINENLSQQDLQYVIAHELGHIILEHCS
ncbi:MAG: ImmA/IrrE family metallo-endopeptidase, partial [Thermincolia bacterium]